MLRQLLSSHENDLKIVPRLHHNNQAQPVVIIGMTTSSEWQQLKNGKDPN